MVSTRVARGTQLDGIREEAAREKTMDARVLSIVDIVAARSKGRFCMNSHRFAL